MKTEAHTPGPWETFANKNGCGVTPLRESSGDIALCSGHDSRRSPREEMANARLISAAPDLLEALEACIASLERADTAEGVCCCGDSMDAHSNPMDCGHSPVDMGEYYARNAINIARSAIAKATGAA